MKSWGSEDPSKRPSLRRNVFTLLFKKNVFPFLKMSFYNLHKHIHTLTDACYILAHTSTFHSLSYSQTHTKRFSWVGCFLKNNFHYMLLLLKHSKEKVLKKKTVRMVLLGEKSSSFYCFFLNSPHKWHKAFKKIGKAFVMMFETLVLKLFRLVGLMFIILLDLNGIINIALKCENGLNLYG